MRGERIPEARSSLIFNNKNPCIAGGRSAGICPPVRAALEIPQSLAERNGGANTCTVHDQRIVTARRLFRSLSSECRPGSKNYPLIQGSWTRATIGPRASVVVSLWRSRAGRGRSISQRCMRRHLASLDIRASPILSKKSDSEWRHLLQAGRTFWRRPQE